MSLANKKTCTVCGKEYTYCPTCERLNSWKYYADTSECFQIFMIFSQLREGVITETEAITQFGNTGITLDYDFNSFIPSVANEIKRILGTNSTEETPKKKSK
jgi:hypothetical protein